MRTKYYTIVLIIMASLLAVLMVMAIQVRGSGYENLLLASPKSNTSGIAAARIEEIGDKKVVTAYEIIQKKTIQSHASYHVEMKYVNYAYSSVMRYPVLAGGFFTRSAQESKSKAVVLNEWAAFELFGGVGIVGGKIVIDNLPYHIVGVIDDGDEENSNLYLPITLTDQRPDTFMALMDIQNGISEEYVISVYKQLGMIEEQYSFINLDKMKREIQERAMVGCLMASCLFAFFMLTFLGKRFRRKVKKANSLSKQYYFGHLLRNQPGFLLSMIFSAGLLTTAALVTMRLAAYIIETCLKWGSFDLLPQAYHSDCFAVKTTYIQEMSVYSYICLLALVAAMLVFVALVQIKTE